MVSLDQGNLLNGNLSHWLHVFYSLGFAREAFCHPVGFQLLAYMV